MSLDFKFLAEDVIREGRTTRQNIKIIQDWIQNLSEKDVPNRLQDELIALFLTCLENDITVTKSSIVAFYQLRKEAPDIFDGRNVDNEDLLLALQTMTMIIIPVRTPNNDAILLFKLNDPDYKSFNVVAKLKLFFMIMDLAYHGGPPKGLLLVVDTSRFGFRHMARLKMDAMKKFFTFVEDALPLKLTQLHFLNSNFVLRTLWSMVKRFIKEDLLTKFILHEPDPKQEKIFNYIPKQCLPNNYGGDLPDIQILQDITYQRLKANQNFWDKEEALRMKF